MSLFCRHEWQTSYVLNYIHGAYLPAYYQCTKCGERKQVSDEAFNKAVASLQKKDKRK